MDVENDIGSVNSFNSRAFSQSFSSDTIPLSENIIYNAYHRAHIHQSIPYLNDNGQLRWHPGLDDYWESSSCVDWPDALYHAYVEPEYGKHNYRWEGKS